MTIRAVLGLTLASVLVASPCVAQSAAEFYRGKTVTLLIGVSAGGEYDVQTRLIARHLGKHIPGNPAVVAQNMTGAGGATAANYIYSVAAKDGTFLSSIVNGLIPQQIVGVAGPQFDSAKMNWIGAIAPTVETLALWHTSGVKTIEDARKKEIIIGAVGRGGITYTFPQMMNEFAGVKFKIVVGYPGGNDVNLAMERGEVAGRNNTWSSWKTTKRGWLDEKLISILAYQGPKPVDLLNVPSLEELASNEADRQTIRLVAGGAQFGRPLAAAPGVPVDRVAALRQAFLDTMRDPEFLKEAGQQDIEVDPVDGPRLQSIAEELARSPESVKARGRRLIE